MIELYYKLFCDCNFQTELGLFSEREIKRCGAIARKCSGCGQNTYIFYDPEELEVLYEDGKTYEAEHAEEIAKALGGA